MNTPEIFEKISPPAKAAGSGIGLLGSLMALGYDNIAPRYGWESSGGVIPFAIGLPSTAASIYGLYDAISRAKGESK